ncbi:MAG: phosphoribosylformylglycinamidine synthase, partial [Gammaproteobacteria bacterium]|nr:phosphoribosylformylglycinamidine synthase [Gammaproteobacteria bacterium]
MLQIPGSPALSAFRLAKLLDRLKGLDGAVTGLAASFMHFADLERPLSARERGVLARLLTYGPSAPAADDAGSGDSLLIVPRPGTFSPWSSKATDIARVCGLGAVRRIERGIAYRLRAARPLGSERLLALAPALYDRMTEAALLDPEEAVRLFEQAPPRRLRQVPLASGREALAQADRDLGLALSDEEMDYLL